MSEDVTFQCTFAFRDLFDLSGRNGTGGGTSCGGLGAMMLVAYGGEGTTAQSVIAGINTAVREGRPW